MSSYLKPCETFVLAPDGNLVIHFHLHLQQLPSCVSQPLICCFFFGGGGRGCRGVLVLCLTIFLWGLDLELLHHHHRLHHSTPTWEFHRSGVMSGEAPPRQTHQECTKREGKKDEAEVDSSQENTALHCSPTFAFHSSPLCFKITSVH